jgi:Protein of unknown function (DUF1236)
MRLLFPTTAVMLLLTASLAMAQGPQDRPGRDGQDRRDRGASDRPGGLERMQERTGPRGEMRERREPRVLRDERPRAAERQGGDRQKDVERQQRNVEALRAQEQRERRDRAQRRERSEERLDRAERRIERQKERVDRSERKDLGERKIDRTERKDVGERKLDRAERGERDKTRADRLEPRERRIDQAQDRNDDRVQRRHTAREQRERLTQEQRARFYTSFERRRVTNVDFRVRVGTRIPRHVRLYPIPVSVVSLVPAYRYYRYVYVEDTICIVDPVTYEIVDVIEVGGGPAVIDARLELLDWERALILDSISADFPEPELDLRLALGAEVPVRVELHTFPDVVLDRIPKVREYRFVVSGGDIVIIDPRDREIALVVHR